MAPLRAMLTMAFVLAVGATASCGRGGAIDDKYVGSWQLDRDGSDHRVREANLELRGDGTYRLTITVDGNIKLLENQWSKEGDNLLLRFAPENTGDERRINAHGVDIVSAKRLSLLYRVKVGEVVRANLERARR
jgi:hypothetical protein